MFNIKNYIKYRVIYRTIKNSGMFDIKYYLLNNLDVRLADIDPIRHYIRYGANELRTPSNEFDSKAYLEKYPDVKVAKINPLFHYLRHGIREGRSEIQKYDRKQVTLDKKNESLAIPHTKTVVYLSCWLRGKESIHDGIGSIYSFLHSEGIKTEFITYSKELLSLSDINKSYDFTLDDAVYTSFDKYKAPAKLLMELVYICKNHFKRRIAKSTNKLEKNVNNAYSYWKEKFLFNQPKLVVIWGATSPISRLHIWICKELDIKYLILERGHFPETISVDNFGQFYHGSSNTIPQTSNYDRQHFEEVVAWVNRQNEVAYSNNNSDYIDERIIAAGKEGKRIILFIGVNDDGSGVAYNSSLCQASQAVSYHSSFIAVQDVKSVINKLGEDTLLIIKPHPADHNNYKDFLGDNCILCQSSNINTLIKLSDICVTLSTTAIARCIIENKPIVLLSLADISGLDIAYECHRKSDLSPMFRAALSGIRYDEKRLNAEKFIYKILSTNIFLVNNDLKSNFTFNFQSIDDLCKHIYNRLNIDFISETIPSLIDECKYSHFTFDSEYSVYSTFRKITDIVVPIYRDRNLTKLCVESVLSSNLPPQSRLILINDASPEPAVDELLSEYENFHNVEVIRNVKNIGFVGSVNKGIAFAGDRDVILLNSDAIVPYDFLSRLRVAAYSHPMVSTVTPFSNNASIFSVFKSGPRAMDSNNVPEYVRIMDEQCQSSNPKISIEVPVGHGFCLYLRRSALNRVGYFDEMKFGKGYSEEVDFCLRARALGFVNVVIPSMFVGHVGGVSFAENQNEYRIANRKIIADKYPFYFKEIKYFHTEDPLNKFRLT